MRRGAGWMRQMPARLALSVRPRPLCLIRTARPCGVMKQMRRRAGWTTPDEASHVSTARATVYAVMFTIVSTLASRGSTATGFFTPSKMGPIAVAPPSAASTL